MDKGVDNKPKMLKSATIADVNIVEQPLFISSKKEVETIESLVRTKELSEEVEDVLRRIVEDLNKGNPKLNAMQFPVVYRMWYDSKGIKRELLIANSMPNLQSLDVWNSLIGLYLEKLGPISFDNMKQCYKIDSDELKFTLNELLDYMGKSHGGDAIKKLKEEISRLRNAQYYSFTNGVIYDKKNQEYVINNVDMFSLLTDVRFRSKKKKKDEVYNDNRCTVNFNKIIINNIRYQFFKYFNKEKYYNLPSRGFYRRLYLYVQGNQYIGDKKAQYIKRSFKVLSQKLPIYPYQPSKIKEKLLKPLRSLREIDVIKDFLFSDEFPNNDQEPQLYILFSISKEDFLREVNKKIGKTSRDSKKALKKANKGQNDLFIPEDMHAYLVNIVGFSENKAESVLKEHDIWEITKYVLWLQEQANDNKIKTSFGAVLNWALTSGFLNLDETHKHIIKIVESAKNKQSKTAEELNMEIDNAYEKYLEKAIKKYKKEDQFGYEIIHNSILQQLNVEYESKIREFGIILNQHISDDEREKVIEKQEEWFQLKEKQVKSKLFKYFLYNNLAMALGLDNREDFKIKYLKKNS
ncbi:hypothetical protein [Hathewaya limosa]|uniref:Uncharacterized protein n=1 Tax=Hathewaya limosa TaxID=1536 RepID=A0ABU0JUB4_HATLI|nr:hypothetical protein [Hathewaya limosa]MDQ0480693.1 hypothetical protein [Hathewaya limosa]